jgi:DNA invertase Pin-like site-specific DNA recombinase
VATTAQHTLRTAFSYLRYSDPKQSLGDSERRQVELAQKWCEKNGAILDTGRYCDRGVSAFRGKHRKMGALAAFLADVEAERIPRGSVLLIESMDRLSRESPVHGVHLLTGLLVRGITLIVLTPTELELTERSNLFALLQGQLSQARGHDESEQKSRRVTEAWDERKRVARAGNGIVTRKLPAWVEEKNGKLRAVPGRAAVVKKMFELALAGRGLAGIATQLEKDRVAPWGRASCWGRAYVHKILRSRATLGEYQPMKDDKPDGAPIAGYYPKLVDEDTWQRVQVALKGRTKKAGRIGKRVANLFTGLLWDARTGGKMLIAWQKRGRVPKGATPEQREKLRYRVLVSAQAMARQNGVTSFPNDIFETHVLKHLKEVKVADITGEEKPSETATLTEELRNVDEQIRDAEANFAAGDENIPSIMRAMRGLDTKKQDILHRLAAARQADESPLSGVWSEARTLLDVAKDEAGRMRLRTLLQAAITDVWVLVVRHPGRTWCAVQVNFRSGVRRYFAICYDPATRGRKADSWARSIEKLTGKALALDLRTPAGVALVEGLFARPEAVPSSQGS